MIRLAKPSSSATHRADAATRSMEAAQRTAPRVRSMTDLSARLAKTGGRTHRKQGVAI